MARRAKRRRPWQDIEIIQLNNQLAAEQREREALDTRLREVEAERDELQKRFDDHYAASAAVRAEAHAERDKAIKAEAATRQQFADLKKRLHDCEIENAQLRGYAKRVAEDDHARDGFFPPETDAEGNVVLKPKRPEAERFASYDPNTELRIGAIPDAMEHRWRDGDKRPRVHWVNY